MIIESEDTTDLVILPPLSAQLTVPTTIVDAGDGAARRFLEFFTANICNLNTRAAYAQAVAQFLRWCDGRRLPRRRAGQAPRPRL